MTPLIVLPTWLIDVLAVLGGLLGFCILALDLAGVEPWMLHKWWHDGWRPWRPWS